jgi:alcohol dehydrogenase class IV
MCMAAACGHLAFLKGLGIGHAITRVLGAHYHMPHGRTAMYGLLCFVKANQETCKKQFRHMANCRIAPTTWRQACWSSTGSLTSPSA